MPNQISESGSNEPSVESKPFFGPGVSPTTGVLVIMLCIVVVIWAVLFSNQNKDGKLQQRKTRPSVTAQSQMPVEKKTEQAAAVEPMTQEELDAFLAQPDQKPLEEVWSPVADLSGSTNKASDFFVLSGKKARISYNCNGDEAVFLSVFLYRGSQNSGVPEFTTTNPGHDTWILHKPLGEYYIKVISANTDWRVVIEELDYK